MTTAIFIQAPADLAYALTIQDSAVQRGSAVLLIVVNVRSLYDYLLEALPGDAGLHFIPYVLQPMPRSPWALAAAGRALAVHYKTIFAGQTITDVYFFCTEYDAVTPYFLKRLSKTARMFCVDHYGQTDPSEKQWPLRLTVKWVLLLVATGISFSFRKEICESGGERVWRTSFDPSQWSAQRIAVAPTHGRFSLPAKLQRPFVILLDANDEATPDLSQYPEVMSDLLARLQARGIQVALKTHPRSSSSPFLLRFNLSSLPTGCPLELFDLRGVTAVVGIYSLGLAAAAKLGLASVSILDLVGFRTEDTRTFWRGWMNRHSGGKVLFPHSTGEAIDMIAGVKP